MMSFNLEDSSAPSFTKRFHVFKESVDSISYLSPINLIEYSKSRLVTIIINHKENVIITKERFLNLRYVKINRKTRRGCRKNPIPLT
ncbi:hypothetical protein EMIT0210MI2_11401 [Priestia megaterium]